MARNAVRKATATEQQAVPGEVPPLKGGTLGVPSAQAKLSTLPKGMVGSTRRREEGVPGGRRYEVVGGPDMVTYPGQGKVRLLRGKIVSDQSCDIELLKRQGVKLQEIMPDPVPVEPEPEVEKEPETDPPTDGDEDD